jgi:endonuclease/exonuclease/phosphatase family metal-dependent hydrolase
MRRAARWAAAPLAAAIVLVACTPPLRADDTLTVVTLNLWHDQQDWPRRRALIVDEMRALAPDVICLQEVLQHEKLRNQAADLAEQLGCRYTFSSVDPESSAKRYGNAILTRHRMLETAWKPLEPRDDYRTVAHMRVDVHGRPVDVFVTHLHHTAEGGAIRARQIADLLAWVEQRRGKGALVLAGDFNAAPGVPELAPILDRYVDVFGALHAGADTVSTLNPAKGHAPRRIDYIFISRGGKAPTPLSSERAFDEPAPDGTWPSDHFGVVARLRIPR